MKTEDVQTLFSSTQHTHAHRAIGALPCSKKQPTTTKNTETMASRALTPFLRRSVVSARTATNALRGGGRTPPLPAFARIPAPKEPVSGRPLFAVGLSRFLSSRYETLSARRNLEFILITRCHTQMLMAKSLDLSGSRGEAMTQCVCCRCRSNSDLSIHLYLSSGMTANT